MRWRARPAEQAPEPAPPAAAPALAGGLLEAYGAKFAPDFAGFWVYAFADRLPDGTVGRVWYAGQTAHLWSRWRDHEYRWRERFAASAKYVIPVSDQAEADTVELALIRFYDPECNTQGRADQLRADTVRLARPHKPRRAASLDQSQATN